MSQIGQRQRFEIFKRDGFRCAYCGRTPPQVLLQVDHIIARSNGGLDDPVNLITSCFDCNVGKSDVPLSELPHGHQETVEQRREKLEQLRAISLISIEQQQEQNRLFTIVSDRWIELQGDNPKESSKSGDHGEAVRRFVKLLPVGDILEALELAFTKFGHQSQYSVFRYFCGVCWRKIKKDLPPPPFVAPGPEVTSGVHSPASALTEASG